MLERLQPGDGSDGNSLACRDHTDVEFRTVGGILERLLPGDGSGGDALASRDHSDGELRTFVDLKSAILDAVWRLFVGLDIHT
jgi:hypothetical protein